MKKKIDGSHARNVFSLVFKFDTKILSLLTVSCECSRNIETYYSHPSKRRQDQVVQSCCYGNTNNSSLGSTCSHKECLIENADARFIRFLPGTFLSSGNIP